MLRQRLTEAFGPEALVLGADGDDRPDFIVVDERYGLVIVDVESNGSDPASRKPYVRLNRKIADLREEIPVVDHFRPQRLVLFLDHPTELLTQQGTSGWALSLVDLNTGGWISRLPQEEADPDDLQDLRAALAPSLVFEIKARRGATDAGRAERHRVRAILDAEQAAAATGPVADVLRLSGPPGSGKTLVLAGRARYLSGRHPDWRIGIVCYNNALVPYLRTLVANHPNVEVDTFGKFARKRGLRIALDDAAQAEYDVDAVLARGLEPDLDAVLVDEAQDFADAWVRLLLNAVRPDRGGIVLAGDNGQALYREVKEFAALAGRSVESCRLTRGYRSTRQIMAAAVSTQSRSGSMPRNDVPVGEPVDLIWAPTWNDQAAAIAWEVGRLIESGERGPEDIAILVTQKPGTMNRLRRALDHVRLPYLVVDRSNAASFDPSSPEIKVMTVHAAKGYEFDVVLLFGLEALPYASEDAVAADQEAARRARVGYVGMTRARDQLLITYTRDNPYLDALRNNPDVRIWTWPDDYEV
ncbi:AAA family ATPase [Micromonospora yasonensis]|uniref:3'-5' exonuclease n=1 Tax=Micromonospora yasonensis TaxID=1128667 RepID=UPI00222EA207|nr:3'-5' exonuclease [Micromonospora yasonensis]MCW3842859.1 AAA family ATPase [Micromonospora yasonensis]